MMRILRIMITAGCMLLFIMTVDAQSNQWNLWTGLVLEKDLGKRWELSVGPEWRLQQWDYKGEYLIETSLSYKPVQYLSLNARYRFSYLDPREGSKEISHQLAFDVNGKIRYERFRFDLRTRLTNYSDFDLGEYMVNPYLRYRLKMEYNVKGIRLFPLCSVELFHQLDDREINKIRYTIGLEYGIRPNHRVEVKYHLQDYLKKEYFRNVIALQYKFIFY